MSKVPIEAVSVNQNSKQNISGQRHYMSHRPVVIPTSQGLLISTNNNNLNAHLACVVGAG